MNRFSIAILLVTLVSCSGAMMRSPHSSVKDQPGEINDLHNRMAQFANAWYWKKDQRAFWQFISRRGKLNRITDEQIFFDAFTKPLDEVYLGNRDMSAGPLEHVWEHAPDAKRLNPGQRSFAIVEMEIARNGPYNPDIPPQRGLFVFYAIQGDGFATKALRLTWVREGDTWMVWDIEELDTEPREEAKLPPPARTIGVIRSGGLFFTHPSLADRPASCLSVIIRHYFFATAVRQTYATPASVGRPGFRSASEGLIHGFGVCKRCVCKTMTESRWTRLINGRLYTEGYA